MNRISSIAAVAVLAALLSGCGTSSNFVLYKSGTGKHFFVNSTRPEIKTYLCDTGDLEKVLNDSTLPANVRQDLVSSICATAKVKEKVLQVLDSMTKEQRSELKSAFQRNGYDVNIINC
jgi:hypothetical protein